MATSGVADAYKETVGGFVALNNDYDEGRTDAAGHPVADNTGLPYAVPTDDELLDAILTLPAPESNGDRWRLTYPDSVRIWRVEDDGSLSLVLSGTNQVISGSTVHLLIEGITASAAARDVELVASYVPDGEGAFEGDRARLTVIAADLRTDSDNDGSITPADDAIEDDADKPGVIAWAGSGIDARITLTLPVSVSPSAATFTFSGLTSTGPLTLKVNAWGEAGEVMLPGVSYSAADLGFTLANRTIELYGRVAVVAAGQQPGEIRLVVTMDPTGAGVAATADAVRIMGVAPVQLTRLYSRQDGPVAGNYIPGGSGGGNVLMTAPVRGQAGSDVVLDGVLDLPASVLNALHGKLILAHRVQDSGDLVIEDSQSIFAANGLVYARWFITDTGNKSSKLKDPVVIVDLNGNGYDPTDLVFGTPNRTFRTVWQDEYDAAVATLQLVAAAGLTGGAVPPGIEFGTMTAGAFLGAFLNDGSFALPYGGSDGGTDITIQPNQPGQTSNVGVIWETDGSGSGPYSGVVSGTIKRYAFDAGGYVAQQIVNSPEMRDAIVQAFTGKGPVIERWFQEHPDDTAHMFVWELPDLGAFEKHGPLPAGWDLSYAIHGHTGFNGYIAVTVQNDATLSVTSLQVIGTLSDVYDFNYESGIANDASFGGAVVRLAAIVQTGYGSLGTSGRIFNYEVGINEDVAAVGEAFEGLTLR